MPEFDMTFKLVIFGDGGVGKTSLTQRYLTGVFNDSTRITIGVEFHIKDLEIDGKRVRLQIWDFGGEERFRFLLPSYCRGGNGGIFMFSVTSWATLQHLDQWLDVTSQYAPKMPILMIGTKVDCVEERAVKTQEALQSAKAHKLSGYAEVSAKTGANVESVFETITKVMVNRMAKGL